MSFRGNFRQMSSFPSFLIDAQMIVDVKTTKLSGNQISWNQSWCDQICSADHLCTLFGNAFLAPRPTKRSTICEHKLQCFGLRNAAQVENKNKLCSLQKWNTKFETILNPMHVVMLVVSNNKKHQFFESTDCPNVRKMITLFRMSQLGTFFVRSRLIFCLEKTASGTFHDTVSVLLRAQASVLTSNVNKAKHRRD